MMKIRRNVTGVLASLCLWMAFLDMADAQNPPDVYQAAGAGLTLMLESIPRGYEGRYGFADREAFAAVTLGLPYQMYTVHPEMMKDVAEITDNMLLPVEEWRFPLLYNGRIRALLTVAKLKGQWQAVDIGAALLASEIDALERNISLGNRDVKRIILRLYQIKTDYAVIADASAKVTNGAFYPLTSEPAGVGASMKARAGITSLSFQNLLPILKARYRHEYLNEK